jgi:rhodanese-related sulfurtransferase
MFMHRLVLVTASATFAAFCSGGQSGGQSQTATPGPAYQALVKDAKTRVKEMDVEQLKALRSTGDRFVLIDVREDGEWTAGHATGAVHIGKGVIERDIEAKVAQKDTKLVLYCGGGSRSALAADILMKMGYSNIVSLTGGFGAYKSAGLPVEK